MGLICKLPEIICQAKTEYENMKSGSFAVCEELGQSDNVLAQGDNAEFMKYLLSPQTEDCLEGKIQQIYIDPPFFSKANYDAVIKLQSENGETAVKHTAYEDVWKQGMAEYLKMLCVRLYLIRDLLSKEGTVWVHLDWHGVHYVKILMDEVFGEKNFINEIIWTYKSGGSSKKHFARKHDTILVYGKTDKYYLNLPKEKSYNRGLRPYRFKGVKEFCDDVGWYTMVNMKDVWNIDMVGRTSAERTGYATQKPEALMERIIKAGSREGDICADFFCGSGTLGAAAGKLNRRWICCDNGALAIAASLKRLDKAGQSMKVMYEAGEMKMLSLPPADTDIHSLQSKGEVLIDAFTWTSLFKEKINFTIELKEYKLKESAAQTLKEGKSRQAVEKTVDANSLALVDYWSVDVDFDGKTFRPDKIFYREKSGLCCEFEKEMDITGFDLRTIMVKIVDVLGNISFVQIDGGKICE